MKNFAIIASIFIIVFICLRFFFKRLRLLTSLKKAAKRAGAALQLTTPLFWFPTNRCKHNEMLVKCADAVYSIKVIGLFQKYCDLHFWNAQEYATRKYLFHWQIDQATPLGSKATRHKRLDIDFDAGLLEVSGGRQHIRFYLLSPTNSPIKITKNNGNSIVNLEPGDKIDDIIFADREYLYQYIALALHNRVIANRKMFEIK